MRVSRLVEWCAVVVQCHQCVRCGRTAFLGVGSIRCQCWLERYRALLVLRRRSGRTSGSAGAPGVAVCKHLRCSGRSDQALVEKRWRLAA
jgi:hypothetical protein